MFETQEERNNFYWSKDWRKMRREILRRDNYECRYCKENGLVTTTEDTRLFVDHIKELKDRPDLALDPNNLQVLCFYHHELKHHRIFESKHFKPKKTKWSSDEWW